MNLSKAAYSLVALHTTTYAFHVNVPQPSIIGRSSSSSSSSARYVEPTYDVDGITSNLMNKVTEVPSAVVDRSQSMSVTQAADAAADAAKAAAEAAAAISAPTVKAAAVKTTAAAAAGATVKGKVAVPTLAEFILHPKPAAETAGSTSPNIMEKFGSLMENLLKMTGNSDLKLPDDINFPNAKSAIAGAAAGAVVWENLVGNLRLEEFGAWYVAGIATFTALTQRQAGKEAAEAEFEEQLIDAKEKATMAAMAADRAANEAAKAKDFATSDTTSTSSKFREGLLKSLSESRQELMSIDEVC